jgi:RNA polymerase sigma-70 factor, ECF subfamily
MRGESSHLRLVGEPQGAQPASPVAAGDGAPEPGPERGRAAPSSFDAAFRCHYTLVHRMLRVYGVDEALLDDAAQDVFVVVHRRWDDYDGRTAFRAWLLGITRRVASSYRRASRRLRARLDAVEAPTPASLELHVSQREQLEHAAAAIERLSVRHREVFVLTEVAGLTAPEVAESLGIKLNTVYSRLRVARERFAVAMARERSTTKGLGHVRSNR